MDQIIGAAIGGHSAADFQGRTVMTREHAMELVECLLEAHYDCKVTFDNSRSYREHFEVMKGRVIASLSDMADRLDDATRRVEESNIILAKLINAEAALQKLRSYNVDIAAGRINYRPHDHIQVIDEALAPLSSQSCS